MNEVESDVLLFKRTLGAVTQFELKNVEGRFAIGDALLLDVPPGPQDDGVNALVKFERLAIILQDRGYEYSAMTLLCYRDTAAAYPRDLRAGILEKFPRITWSVLEQCRAHIDLWDEFIAVVEDADREESPSLPDAVWASIRKRRTVRVHDVRETLTQLKMRSAQEAAGVRQVMSTLAEKFGPLENIMESIKHIAREPINEPRERATYVPASFEGLVYEFSQVQDRIASAMQALDLDVLRSLPAQDREQLDVIIDMCRDLLETCLSIITEAEVGHVHE